KKLTWSPTQRWSTPASATRRSVASRCSGPRCAESRAAGKSPTRTPAGARPFAGPGTGTGGDPASAIAGSDPCPPRHERSDDGRHRAPGRLAHLVELQPAGGDQLRGRPVAATASAEATPGRLQAVLPRGEPRRVGPDVLDEDQLTVGPQHAR